MEDDEIIVLTDSDSDEEEEEDEEEEKAPVVPITKRHKCTLCGLPVSDFNDLQVILSSLPRPLPLLPISLFSCCMPRLCCCVAASGDGLCGVEENQ
jgi:hypothetical protein